MDEQSIKGSRGMVHIEENHAFDEKYCKRDGERQCVEVSEKVFLRDNEVPGRSLYNRLAVRSPSSLVSLGMERSAD